jgi:hypothetical protein
VIVYIEYISRLPGASLEQFHFVAGRGQSSWSGEYEDDRLVLNLARTMRLGPEPGYLAVWYNARAGIERIEDWIDIFQSGAADHIEEPFKMAAQIDFAGCYEPLVEPVQGRGPYYYGEYVDFDGSHDDVRALYEKRRARHPELELNLLADRIGTLGPDPRGLAVWSLPTVGHLDAVARDLDGGSGAVRLVASGLYSDVGREIL